MKKITIYLVLLLCWLSPLAAQTDSSGIDKPLPPAIEKILVRGMEKGMKGDYKGAVADFSRVIQQLPTLADAYFNRGLAYQKLRSWQNAIADFNQTLVLDPKFADAYLARGYVYLSLSQWDKARFDFQSAAREFEQQGNMSSYQQAIAELNKLP